MHEITNLIYIYYKLICKERDKKNDDMPLFYYMVYHR